MLANNNTDLLPIVNLFIHLYVYLYCNFHLNNNETAYSDKQAPKSVRHIQHNHTHLPCATLNISTITSSFFFVLLLCIPHMHWNRFADSANKQCRGKVFVNQGPALWIFLEAVYEKSVHKSVFGVYGFITFSGSSTKPRRFSVFVAFSGDSRTSSQKVGLQTGTPNRGFWRF